MTPLTKRWMKLFMVVNVRPQTLLIELNLYSTWEIHVKHNFLLERLKCDQTNIILVGYSLATCREACEAFFCCFCLLSIQQSKEERQRLMRRALQSAFHAKPSYFSFSDLKVRAGTLSGHAIHAGYNRGRRKSKSLLITRTQCLHPLFSLHPPVWPQVCFQNSVNIIMSATSTLYNQVLKTLLTTTLLARWPQS